MSLDIYFSRVQETEVFWRNITHNLGVMAREAGIYQCLWRPAELGITTAGAMVPILEHGLALLESDPERFRAFDAPNGWGKYEHFVPFVREVLDGAREYPDAAVRVSV